MNIKAICIAIITCLTVAGVVRTSGPTAASAGYAPPSVVLEDNDYVGAGASGREMEMWFDDFFGDR